MAFEGRSEYLWRLRERAFERMKVEEVSHGRSSPPTRGNETVTDGAPGVVARRTALRMMAAGAVVGAMRARAAGVMSSRMAAPQYGAPSWPGTWISFDQPEQSPDWMKPGRVVRDRKELAEQETWKEGPQRLLMLPEDGQSRSGYSLDAVPARWIYYDGGRGTHTLAASVVDGVPYVVPGGQTFYVESPAGLIGVSFTPKSVVFRRQLYQGASAAEDLGTAIRSFARRTAEKQLADGSGGMTEVPLGRTLVRDGWSPSGTFLPVLTQISATGDVLTMWLQGAPVHVDWKVGKLVEG